MKKTIVVMQGKKVLRRFSFEVSGFPEHGTLCPKCLSADIFFAKKGTPNADCFECGRCGVILPNEELVA